MAKAKTKATQTRSEAAADNLPAKYDYAQYKGTGFEGQTQADMAIPFLQILQGQSPPCVQGKPEFIKGAKPGMLMDNVTKKIYQPGTVGFVPCFTEHNFVEWRPRDQGGGMVGKYKPSDPVVSNAMAGGQFGKWKTQNNNDLVETFDIWGLLLAEDGWTVIGPIVVSFNSTKIKVYKALMTRFRTMANRPPMFAHRLTLKTILETNPKGSYFNYVLEGFVNDDLAKSLIPADHQLIKTSFGFWEEVSQGKVRAAYNDAARGDDEGTPHAASDSNEESPY